MKSYTKDLHGKNLIDGVLIKELIRNRDERGFFEELIRVNDAFFREGFGQLSHSFMHGGVIKAWHIHKTQIDWWYVARGDLQVALYDKRKDTSSYGNINEFLMGEHGANIILKIPAGVAHGCKVMGNTAELFYVTSSVYNPDEEGRIAYDDKEIGFDWLENQPIS